jgi:hypothetical protein
VVGTERRPTRWDTWDRYAPLTGIVAVLLWIVGVVVMESIGGPGEGGPEAYPRYYDDEGGGILGASTTFAIGTLFFLWFLGTLRAALHAAEGGVGRLAGIAFAGGLAFGVLSLATMAPDAAGAIRYWVDDETLEPAAAEALNALGSGFFLLAELSAGLFLIATALAVLRLACCRHGSPGSPSCSAS